MIKETEKYLRTGGKPKDAHCVSSNWFPACTKWDSARRREASWTTACILPFKALPAVPLQLWLHIQDSWHSGCDQAHHTTSLSEGETGNMPHWTESPLSMLAMSHCTANWLLHPPRPLPISEGQMPMAELSACHTARAESWVKDDRVA